MLTCSAAVKHATTINSEKEKPQPPKHTHYLRQDVKLSRYTLSSRVLQAKTRTVSQMERQMSRTSWSHEQHRRTVLDNCSGSRAVPEAFPGLSFHGGHS